MYTIRKASAEDAAALKKLNDLFNNDPICNSADGIAASLASNPREIVCVACDGEGNLAGFCCGQVLMSMCYSVNYGEVTELFVLEEFRRQGIGKKLMAFMESELQRRGVKGFQLWTGGGNTTAQAFYHSCGYAGKMKMMFNKEPK